jgi:hypothetical protein
VGDCFPFACMLSPITSVEKAALYRYEGIVVLAISGGRQPTGTLLGICNCGGHLRLQKAISMTVDHRYHLWIRHADMSRLNTDKLAIFLVGSIDLKVSLSHPALV